MNLRSYWKIVHFLLCHMFFIKLSMLHDLHQLLHISWDQPLTSEIISPLYISREIPRLLEELWAFNILHHTPHSLSPVLSPLSGNYVWEYGIGFFCCHWVAIGQIYLSVNFCLTYRTRKIYLTDFSVNIGWKWIMSGRAGIVWAMRVHLFPEQIERKWNT